MGTAADKVVESFFDYIAEDDTFFHYYGQTNDAALEIAKTRAYSYLISAVAKFKRYCLSNGQSAAYDADTHTFQNELTSEEIDLLGKLCFLEYLTRDRAKLRSRVALFTSKDLNAFSPANERNSFISMVNQFEDECLRDLSRYDAADRLTGELRSIN